jgi:GNAT superfamily N-acetyltransferase
MSSEGVRELRRSDLPAIAALHEERGREGFARPPAPAPEWFAATMFDHPWADPDLPSWVFVDGGEVLGYVGTTARRFCLDGRPLRVGLGTGFLVSARARGRGIGTELLTHMHAGPQDLTVADGSAEATRRLWCALPGGHASVHGSLVWRRVLRPGSAAARSPWWQRRRVPVRWAAAPVDAAARRIGPVRARLAPPTTGLRAETLTPGALAEHTGGYRLRPDYDPAFLAWLFAVLDREPGVVRHLVRDTGGRALGWYVVAVVPGETAQVVGLAGTPDPGPVLDHLLATCDGLGAAAVEGRLDPGLLEVVRGRRCTVHPSSWTLLHAGERGRRALAVLGTPDALFTRLDANWWNGYLLWRQ